MDKAVDGGAASRQHPGSTRSFSFGGWVSEAACQGKAEDFTDFVGYQSHLKEVRRICNGCPVFTECEEFAAEHVVDGVWAGRWHTRRSLRVPYGRGLRAR